MKELFRTNLYIADSDSINNKYSANEYSRKFKSSLLMAKSIGMNPNMIFDSQGFENIIQDETIKKFFVKKILESQKKDVEYSIKIHIFNNYVENNYFNYNVNENPFKQYYNDKIDADYLFSSFNLKKHKLESNSITKIKVQDRLKQMNDFSKYLYNKTGQNIFKIHNNDFPILRESIIDRINYTLKNIKNIEVQSPEERSMYFKLLTTFVEIINNNQTIENRSHFYSALEHNDLKSVFTKQMLQQLKIDIIDISYNSAFIQKGEIFRYKSISQIDKLYECLFNSYSNDDKLFSLYKAYEIFDNIKSKFEILELITNPAKIIDYITDELVNKAEDKGTSTLHNIASYIIPKTRLMGIADSNNILIGVK